MKKALSILLVIMLVLTLVPMGAFSIAASADVADYYTYTVADGNATITDVDTSISGDIVIPSTLDGCRVTAIGSHAFEDCNSLISVTIPNSVTNVGAYAFGNCTSLKSAELPNSITTICDGMFAYCSSLEEVNIPDSIEEIGDVAFYECSALERVIIPDNVKVIEGYAFKFCTSLKEVVVPDSVEEMEIGIFEGCTSLEKLTLPFLGYSLTEPGLPFAFTFGTTDFIESNNYVPESLKTVEITNATSIPSYAFVNCKNIENIVIPDSVISVGFGAFGGCSGLKSITLPFVGNTSVSGANKGNLGYVFGASNTTANQDVVPASLKNVTVTDDEVITAMAFSYCDGIENVVLYDSTTAVAYRAFDGCSGLVSVSMSNSVESIEEYAFRDCNSLTSVYYSGNEGERAYITIDDNNDCLTSATWYYNACHGKTQHTYNNACDTECNVCRVTRETTHNYNGDYICDECGHNSVDISKIFPDISNNAWYSDAVAYAYSNGILKGYANGKFGTSDGIQRQDFLVMLARYDGADLTQYANGGNFSDVGKNSYYEAAVNWGYANGIVAGYDNGKFGVGDKITREQLVTFLYRYANYKGLNIEVKPASASAISAQYKDYNKISTFSKDAVLWAIDRGVIGGKDPQTIAPQGNAQRCEIAQIMYNIFIKEIF